MSEDHTKEVFEENKILRQEVNVTREAAEITAQLVIKQFEETEKILHLLEIARDKAEIATQAKSEFLTQMSHELRTPLNSVIGFSNILLRNKNENLLETDITYLKRILDNGKHLLQLINDILDLSKVEAKRVELEIAPVSLNKLIKEILAQLQGYVREKDVELRAKIPPSVSLFETDAGKLKQVLINLVGNALKFTEKGSVTVRVKEDKDNHQPICIDVIDTGVGIPEDRLDVIFDAFEQIETGTAHDYRGTGLGLAISKSLCQAMGFLLEVESQEGKGSTFSIILNTSKENASRDAVDLVE